MLFSVLLETLEEDSDFIAAAANLTDFQLPWHNKLKKELNFGGRSVRKRKHEDPLQYYRELGEDRVKRLYEIYRVDFEMFGYSVEDIFFTEV